MENKIYEGKDNEMMKAMKCTERFDLLMTDLDALTQEQMEKYITDAEKTGYTRWNFFNNMYNLFPVNASYAKLLRQIREKYQEHINTILEANSTLDKLLELNFENDKEAQMGKEIFDTLTVSHGLIQKMIGDLPEKLDLKNSIKYLKESLNQKSILYTEKIHAENPKRIYGEKVFQEIVEDKNFKHPVPTPESFRLNYDLIPFYLAFYKKMREKFPSNEIIA